MGRRSFLIFVCVLALSRATPITDPVRSIHTEEHKLDPEVKELLTKPQDTVQKEEPAKVVSEENVPVVNVQKDETPLATPEQANRDARLLRNEETNDISSSQDTEVVLLQKLNNKCGQKDISSCFLLKLVAYMNRLLKKSNIEVIEGVHITQTTSADVQVEQESLPRLSPGEDDETQLTTLFTNKLWRFLRTRSLRWNILPDADVCAINVGMSIKTGKAIEKGMEYNFRMY
ncbi:hypothetical protein L9F63_025220 [Diploptera punctata]|uniref:Uncharacterized protein n=1 Tax=Diploptera punctata TaxID=6984 RepID=A0AAD7ZCR9_DIPPU|nr:hypothetical protein L9F63_025220 [Diploptera punctata]